MRLLSQGGSGSGDASDDGPRYRVEEIKPDETAGGAQFEDDEWPVAPAQDGVQPGPHDELFLKVLTIYNNARKLPTVEEKRAAYEETLPWLEADEFLEQRNAVILEISRFDERLGEFDRAKQRIQQVLDSADEPSWRPYYYLGCIEYREGNVDRALLTLAKGAELGAVSFKDRHGEIKWTQTLLFRAEIYAERGQDDEALVELSKLLLEEPREIDGLMLRGRIFLRKRGSFDAIRDFGLILIEDPNAAESLVGRSFAYLQLLRKEIAKKELLQAHYLDPVKTYAEIARLAGYVEPTPALLSFIQLRDEIQANGNLEDGVEERKQAFKGLFDNLMTELA